MTETKPDSLAQKLRSEDEAPNLTVPAGYFLHTNAADETINDIKYTAAPKAATYEETL